MSDNTVKTHNYVLVPSFFVKPSLTSSVQHEFQLTDSAVRVLSSFAKTLMERPQPVTTDFVLDATPTKAEDIPEVQKRFRENLHQIVTQVELLLKHKNLNYGNASFEPLRIFDKSGVDSKLSRIDEKLARIKASNELRKSDWSDLLGYLILEGIQHEWFDLTDLYN